MKKLPIIRLPAFTARVLALLCFACHFAAICIAQGALIFDESEVVSPISALGECGEPRISADGRFVVFVSAASNLVPSDRNESRDIFIRDLQSGTTELISRSAFGEGSANGDSFGFDMTPDARFIVFQSAATDLIESGMPPVGNGERVLIYRYDRMTGEMRLINVNRPPVEGHPFATNELSNVSRDLIEPQIVSDGRQVLFEVGSGGDLSLIDTNRSEPDLAALLVWNEGTGETELLSSRYQIDPPETNDTRTAYLPSGIAGGHFLSDDGRFAALSLRTRIPVTGSNLSPDDAAITVVVRDRLMKTNGLPNYITNSHGALILPDEEDARLSIALGLSTNGWLLFEQRGYHTGYVTSFTGEPLISTQLLLRNLLTGAQKIVGSNAIVERLVIHNSAAGTVSDNGDWAAFFSSGTKPFDRNSEEAWEVYLYNRTNDTVQLISDHPFWRGASTYNIDFRIGLTPNAEFVLYRTHNTALFRYDRVAGTNAVVPGSSGMGMGSISADGQKVVFTASPSSMDPDDANPHPNVYCYSFQNGTKELVSIADPSISVATPAGSTALELDAVSADGRFIAFTSRSRNFDPLSNGSPQLWLKNLQTGRNTLVSVDRNGDPLEVDEQFRDVQLSSDGRHLCFTAQNGDLLYGDTNGLGDVFLFDRTSGYTRLVSFNEIGTAAANGRSTNPILLRDGSKVLYQSTATNIAEGITGYDLFAYDLITGMNQMLTTNVAGNGGASGHSLLSSVSGNGRFMTFYSRATNLVLDPPSDQWPSTWYRLYHRDLESGTTAMIGGPDSTNSIYTWDNRFSHLAQAGSRMLFSGRTATSGDGIWLHDVDSNSYARMDTNVSKALLSPSGQFIALNRIDSDVSPFTQVYLRDWSTGEESLVSHVLGQPAPGNYHSRLIGFSTDDRYLLFRSLASDLVAHDDNQTGDIFLHDRLTGFNLLLSRSGNGTANGYTGRVLLTDDGTKVLFESLASDLVPGDQNRDRDIFVVQFQSPDSDEDQLPDDWELGQFESLKMDGTVDSDGDGADDLHEFRSGTNPGSSHSVLRVITISRLESGTTTLFWHSVPGRSYQAQYRERMKDSEWLPLGGPIDAGQEFSSIEDTTSNFQAERYYRVLLVE